MLGLIFILSLIIVLLWVYIPPRWSKKKTLVEFAKLQGGPEPQPILGNFLFLFKHGIIDGLRKLKDEFSLPCNFWIWNDYYYLTDCPQEIKTVLMNTKYSFEKPPMYNDLIKIVLCDTLPMIPIKDIEKWKTERKIIVKAFLPAMWHKYTPVFHKKSSKLKKKLENCANFNSMYDVIIRTVLETFLENFMDVEIMDEACEQDFLEALTELMDGGADRPALSRLIPHWFYKHFTKHGKDFYKRMNFIRYRLEYFIDKKRKTSKHTEFIEDVNKLKLVESLLFREDANFSTSDICRQMVLMFIASMDTSGLSLAYTLMQLGMHQEEQEKAYQEIIEKVGPDREISTSDLPSLNYLEQCINESIRLCPVLPLTGRHITEDLQIGTKILPKGANVFIPPYLVHRNQKYWKNAENFDPSRFSTDNLKNIPLGAFIPFLIGPRDCLGRYYSMAQIKILAANILRNLKVEVDPKFATQMKFNYFIVMKPKENFPVLFSSRVQQANFSKQ